jgi:hypothetical protein
VVTNAGSTVFNFFSVIDIMKKDLMPKIGFGLQLNSIIYYSDSEPISFSGEATNSNFIVFGLTRPGLEPTMYCH